MFSTKVKQEVIASNKTETGYAFVSTCQTFDHGLETMVFPCDENGEVTDWLELEADRYYDMAEALSGHNAIADRWKK